MAEYDPWGHLRTNDDADLMHRGEKGAFLCIEVHDGFACCRKVGHPGQHIATDGEWVVSTWGRPDLFAGTQDTGDTA